jgi:hypothetical protein
VRSPRGEKTSVGDLGLGELGSLIVVISPGEIRDRPGQVRTV